MIIVFFFNHLAKMLIGFGINLKIDMQENEKQIDIINSIDQY